MPKWRRPHRCFHNCSQAKQTKDYCNKEKCADTKNSYSHCERQENSPTPGKSRSPLLCFIYARRFEFIPHIGKSIWTAPEKSKKNVCHEKKQSNARNS